MCRRSDDGAGEKPPPTSKLASASGEETVGGLEEPPSSSSSSQPPPPSSSPHPRIRRGKRDRRHPMPSEEAGGASAVEAVSISSHVAPSCETPTTTTATKRLVRRRIIKRKKKSAMTSRHEGDSKSTGGLESLLPSLAGGAALLAIMLGRQGFRGRATVVGIDLGTTNSVVCVQAPSSGVGEIVCIPDPATGSAVVPSVVSFLDRHHLTSHFVSKQDRERLEPLPPDMLDPSLPHPVDVLVGWAAKDRINTHRYQTLYHAKRIIGRGIGHDSVETLRKEVEFEVVQVDDDGDGDEGVGTSGGSEGGNGRAAFRVPYHLPASTTSYRHGSHSPEDSAPTALIDPSRVGSYVLRHLRVLADRHLGHGNIRSAVVCVPAKFNAAQRDETVRAFKLAGLTVARIIEEPAAAALAYGLHKRDDVRHVLVYDFGGGTLDVSLLYVGEGGYIDVLGSDGDESLGGADFDAAVAHWLLEGTDGLGIRRGDGATTTEAGQAVRAVSKALLAIEDQLRTANGSTMTGEVEDLLEEECPVLKETPLCTLSSLHTISERMKIGLSDQSRDVPDAASVEETCLGLIRSPEANAPPVVTVDALCSAIRPVTLSLTLREYDAAVEPLYRRSILPLSRLLRDMNVSKEEVDEVVMVGGTTRMPQIRELVREEMQKEKLNTHIDPDITVAYGAASIID